MRLDTFIEDLVLGPLQNLYTSLKGDVELRPVDYKRITSYVNQGLKAIYSKFVMNQKEYILCLSDCNQVYCLPEDLIKVLNVYGEEGEYPINDKGDPTSVFTPTYNTLQVPFGVSGKKLSIIYQSKFCELEGYDPEYEFNLPPLLEEALIAFVSSKAYSHINGAANKETAQEFMATFDARCMEVSDKDLAGSSETHSTTKLESRGFI